jgi:FkbM family methyltransferase
MARTGWQKFRDYALGFPAVLDRWKGFTFSQYGEDVLLNCSLRPAREGFYIDVGAYHPWRFSNTYRFYLTGWRGLTIEPNPEIASEFRRLRPRDTHLVMGVAGEASSLTYYRFKDAKLNSFDDARAREMPQAILGRETIECLPLHEIVARHAPGEPIDLLSVDCEGLDYQVLASLDWEKTRPKVVIAEDYEQFRLAGKGGESRIRAFLNGHGYATFAQSAYSFHYLDTTAFKENGAGRGFSLGTSQFRSLAERPEEAPAFPDRRTDPARP